MNETWGVVNEQTHQSQEGVRYAKIERAVAIWRGRQNVDMCEKKEQTERNRLAMCKPMRCIFRENNSSEMWNSDMCADGIAAEKNLF